MVPGRGRQPGCRGRGAGIVSGCDRRGAWSARVDERAAHDAQLGITASDRRRASTATLGNDRGAGWTHRPRPCRARTNPAIRELALVDYRAGARRHGLLAWLFRSLAGGEWGLSITGPSRSLIESTILRTSSAVGWGTALVVGIPLGTWLSARARGPVRWRAPGRGELGRRFAGGVLMGIGGTLAAGCNIGNALTGLSVLALNSLIATAAILGGAAVAIAGSGIRDRFLGLPLTRKER
jgi:Sulphur transport